MTILYKVKKYADGSNEENNTLMNQIVFKTAEIWQLKVVKPYQHNGYVLPGFSMAISSVYINQQPFEVGLVQ